MNEFNDLMEFSERTYSPGVFFRQEQKPILRFYNCVIFSVADRQIYEDQYQENNDLIIRSVLPWYGLQTSKLGKERLTYCK